jgi:hypothetical protein
MLAVIFAGGRLLTPALRGLPPVHHDAELLVAQLVVLEG